MNWDAQRGRSTACLARDKNLLGKPNEGQKVSTEPAPGSTSDAPKGGHITWCAGPLSRPTPPAARSLKSSPVFFQSPEVSVISTLPHNWYLTANQKHSSLESAQRDSTQRPQDPHLFSSYIWVSLLPDLWSDARNTQWGHNLEEIVPPLTMKIEMDIHYENGEFRKVSWWAEKKNAGFVRPGQVLYLFRAKAASPIKEEKKKVAQKTKWNVSCIAPGTYVTLSSSINVTASSCQSLSNPYTLLHWPQFQVKYHRSLSSL